MNPKTFKFLWKSWSSSPKEEKIYLVIMGTIGWFAIIGLIHTLFFLGRWLLPKDSVQISPKNQEIKPVPAQECDMAVRNEVCTTLQKEKEKLQEEKEKLQEENEELKRANKEMLDRWNEVNIAFKYKPLSSSKVKTLNNNSGPGPKVIEEVTTPSLTNNESISIPVSASIAQRKPAFTDEHFERFSKFLGAKTSEKPEETQNVPLN